eukprot:TRINITY_DN3803_c0_g1_i14.p1 TRINITY_DN3803_c0_g1~~TRINITY_DN3803_c0_g1_i14.p1  ORF type:complete len:177 (-),score=24.99 TRINITY_DN3803_c0_g1_i14:1367-1897(-)
MTYIEDLRRRAREGELREPCASKELEEIKRKVRESRKLIVKELGSLNARSRDNVKGLALIDIKRNNSKASSNSVQKQKMVSRHRYNKDELNSLSKSHDSVVERTLIVRSNLASLAIQKPTAELSLSLDKQMAWNKFVPYYRYCNSCQSKNNNYVSLLFNKDCKQKFNWTKAIEQDH